MKLTVDKVLENFKFIHGLKYNYNKVFWVDRYTPITISCPEHGDFSMLYGTHYSGSGCRKCGNSARSFVSYSNEEVQYLKDNWPSTTPKKVIQQALSGHSWSSIKVKAKKLGLDRAPNLRERKLDHIMKATIPNAYLWGLMYADGYIGDKGNFQIGLWKKDSEFLSKIGDVFKLGELKPAGSDMVKVEVSDKACTTELKELLGYKTQKTYNPPDDINFLPTLEMQLAFLIGFSDGDGCITFDKNNSFKHLRIVVHHNWYSFLEELASSISLETSLTFNVNTANSRGNTTLYMGSKSNHKFLIDFIEKHNLPVMKRKWYNKGKGFNSTAHVNDKDFKKV
jgi:hypothetical protein